MTHHPIFDKFTPFSGPCPEGFTADFLGMLCDQRMFDPGAALNPAYEVVGEPLACCGEGYFDLISVLRSVDESRGCFTMVELGAGYGYWLSQGALAARQRGLPFRLIGVEAEPTHFAMMLRHLCNNGIDPADHQILHAAVTSAGGEAWFQTGKPHEWWGQEVVTHPAGYKPPEGTALTQVKAVSLADLLAGPERVDALHMDVQGVEHDVLSSAFAQVRQKVRRVIVGTHNDRVENAIREMFVWAGWAKEFDFSMSRTHDTEFGPVTFGDGVQIWRNPAFDLTR